MPIIEFKCPVCHALIEFLKIKSDEVEPEYCTSCENKGQQNKLEKQFPTGTSFELKGRGWAKDRYGK